jgi:hypothetical protein
MSANIDSNLANWSTTDASNQPDGSDSADIDSEFRRLQSVLRKYLRTKGSDIASASTVNLATATGDYINITGTATITSLGTVSVGMRFILQFNNAAVLAHNATSLILPGNANITAAVGDVAWFESLGSGNWKCLLYQRASGISALAGANSDITSITGLTTPLSIAQGGTAGTTQSEALTALGARPGYSQHNSSTTLLATEIGNVIAIGGNGGTMTLPLGSSVPIGATFYFVSQGGGSSAVAPQAPDTLWTTSSVSSFSLAGWSFATVVKITATTWIVTNGTPLLPAVGYPFPMPQIASGVGQWVGLFAVGSTTTLPSGGTWAYFNSNNGAGYVSVAAGGTVIWSGTPINNFGFAWRIA